MMLWTPRHTLHSGKSSLLTQPTSQQSAIDTNDVWKENEFCDTILSLTFLQIQLYSAVNNLDTRKENAENVDKILYLKKKKVKN